MGNEFALKRGPGYRGRAMSAGLIEFIRFRFMAMRAGCGGSELGTKGPGTLRGGAWRVGGRTAGGCRPVLGLEGHAAHKAEPAPGRVKGGGAWAAAMM